MLGIRAITFTPLFIAAGIALGALSGAAPTPGTRPTSAPASQPSAAAAELYAQIVDQYLAADWPSLPAAFARTKDIAAMTKDQQADVTYIKQAVADGRPAWWDGVKQNRKQSISTHIWNRTLTATFDPSLAAGSASMSRTGSQTTLSVSWLAADMDSPAQAEHGFTKGDLAYVGIWSTLETVCLYASIPNQQLAGSDQNANVRINRFLSFSAAVTSAYYGTPRSRRWAAFLSCDAYFGDHLNADGFIPRRPLAVFLEEEIFSHPAKYPSYRFPRNQRAQTVEGTLATNLMGQFERITPTFAEDKALRDATRNFALANGTAILASGKVNLPSKIPMTLDPAQDADGATQRGQWLLDEVAHPGIHTQPASRPATATRTTTRP